QAAAHRGNRARRRRWSARRSRFARDPEAGEDLAPLRVVPVAEGGRGNARRRRPRSTAQDAVVGPEEDLGVLAVGVGGEAGVGAEVARRPFPDVAHQAERTARRSAVRAGARGGGGGALLVEVGPLGGRRLGAPRLEEL